MDQLFITSFWITNGMLLVALVILYLILTSRRSMEKKGYTEEYISYLRKSHTIRIIAIAIILPVLELISAWIISLLTGPLIEEKQLAYIIVLLLVLVVPFKFFDESLNQNQLKKLAIKTNEKVAIDFNFRTLHLIFDPLWEIILSIVAILYGILFLNIEQWIVYLFLVFPWLMYFTLKGTKYQTRPYLHDNHTYMFTFNLFSFLLFFVYFFSYLVKRLDLSLEVFSGPGRLGMADALPLVILLTTGFIIAVALVGRISLYLANYRQFRSEIIGKEITSGNPFRRKMIFFGSSVIILIAVTSVALSTDLFNPNHVDVGTVKGKYLLEITSSGIDTALIVTVEGISYIDNKYYIQDELDSNEEVITNFIKLNETKQLKAYCDIQLSLNNRIKQYEVCCNTTFLDIPFNTIIKFEHQSDRITRLIEY